MQTTRTNALFLLSIGFLTCGTGWAQRPLPTSGMQPSGHTLQREGESAFADSPRYKARFDRGGVEFTPTLGRRAPRNFPVRLVFDSISRGARRIHTRTAGDPRIVGDSVRIVRDAEGTGAIEERFAIREQDVEQTFRFVHRPAGSGDLTVRIRLETELEASPGRALPHLDLVRPGIGGVRIGGVTGVDATGKRCPGQLHFDGEILELVLPDSFVATASYPIVLDPIIGGIFSGGASFSDRRPDIAYDETNDFYLLVWEIERSATDIDIWGTRFKSDNTGRTGVFVVRAPGIQSHPCIANLASTDMYFVAWQDNTSGNWDIRGRAVEVLSKALSPIVDIATTMADEITPDLAGDATGGGDDMVCVWDDEVIGIQACGVEVQSATSVTVGASTIVAAGSAPMNNRPAISKSGGSTRRAAIVWQASPSAIAARGFTLDLAPASATLNLPFSNAFPDIDGDGTDFTVVAQRPEAGTPTSGDIWCLGLTLPGSAASPMAIRSGPQLLADGMNVDEVHPTITFTGNRYVAAWASADPATANSSRCVIQNLLPDCTSCGSRFAAVRSAGRAIDWPAVASVHSGGGTGDGAWFAFQEENLANRQSLVMVARYEAVAGGSVQTVAAGCAGGGSLSILGDFAFGERVTFQLTGGAASTTVGVFLAGFPGNRQQFACGSCQILLAPITIGVPVQAGNLRFTTARPIPCDLALLGFELDVQVLLAPTGSSPCPILPGLGASNILRATVGN